MKVRAVCSGIALFVGIIGTHLAVQPATTPTRVADIAPCQGCIFAPINGTHHRPPFVLGVVRSIGIVN